MDVRFVGFTVHSGEDAREVLNRALSGLDVEFQLVHRAMGPVARVDGPDGEVERAVRALRDRVSSG